MRILDLDIDSLRPDHLGCYGYGRDIFCGHDERDEVLVYSS